MYLCISIFSICVSTQFYKSMYINEQMWAWVSRHKQANIGESGMHACRRVSMYWFVHPCIYLSVFLIFLPIYQSIYLSIYCRIYVSMHLSMNLHMYVLMYACACIPLSKYGMHVFIYVCIHVRTCVCMHVCVCVNHLNRCKTSTRLRFYRRVTGHSVTDPVQRS